MSNPTGIYRDPVPTSTPKRNSSSIAPKPPSPTPNDTVITPAHESNVKKTKFHGEGPMEGVARAAAFQTPASKAAKTRLMSLTANAAATKKSGATPLEPLQVAQHRLPLPKSTST